MAADQLRTVAERNGLLEQKGALDAGDLASFDEAEESVRQNRLTSAAILMRPDAGMSETDARLMELLGGGDEMMMSEEVMI